MTAEQASFADRLLPGETVLWWAQPGQGLRLTAKDAFLIPFSLLWGGFAFFWETTVLRTNAPAFFALWGIPFVLFGLFMIVGRFLVDAWLRSLSYYAITDRRVLIARIGRWPSFKAVSLDRLPEATLTETAGGRGTISFGQPQPMWTAGRMGAGIGYWVPALDPVPQFLAVDDARRVFGLIQQRTHGAPR